MSAKQSFVIEGLAGEKRLEGSIEINGAKNAALKAMAAAVLFDGQVTLKNVPDTEDIHTMAEVLKRLGAKADFILAGGEDPQFKGLIVKIDASNICKTDIDADLAKTMRASVVLTGPLLARFKTVGFPAPGGCVIGARPIDLFLDGYKKMGGNVLLDETSVIYKISAAQGLQGSNIFFEKISVGATETLMMAAVLAQGKTVLNNCAMEPEIGNVAVWLNKCGSKITGIGTPTITIEGTGGKLLEPKVPFVTIPDRIETGSYLILGALCAERLTIKNCEPNHVKSTIDILTQFGVPVSTNGNEISISNNSSRNDSFCIRSLSENPAMTNELVSPFSLRTHEYPGFPTDLQAPMVVFLTQVSGESTVLETIFEGRFKYVTDLERMGANIKIMNAREITIKGPTPLKELPDGEELSAHDIRAGFAIVLSALLGKGKFRVNNIHLIDRGYEKLEERLAGLGAKIERVAG